MANWYKIQIEWTGNKPNDVEKQLLLDLFQRYLDYDFPNCFEQLANYREPIYSLQQILEICHHLGFMCKGFMVRIEDWDVGYHEVWQIISGRASTGKLEGDIKREVDLAWQEVKSNQLEKNLRKRLDSFRKYAIIE